MLDSEAKRKIESIETDVKSILVKIRCITYVTSVVPLTIWFLVIIFASISLHNYIESQRCLKINRKLDQLIEKIQTLKGTSDVSERL